MAAFFFPMANNKTDEKQTIIIYLSICVNITALIAISVTILLIYVYLTKSGLTEMSEKERYLRREVNRGKTSTDTNKIVYKNVKPDNKTDFFLMELS